ncbi:MAG TPA: hypothetical protein PLS38_12120 [Solirubrobacterales bacterium]|nr:hypothetical protein [Solirubrobacterales bacterium]
MEPSASSEVAAKKIEPGTPGDGLILNPKSWSAPHLDAADQERLKSMIQWFENRGLKLGHGVWDLVFRRV